MVALLFGVFVMIEVGAWVKVHSLWSRNAWWMLGVMAIGLVTATKVIRRIGTKIVVRGIFGVKVVDAHRARIGVVVRAVGRYAGIDVELMTGEHFELNAVINRAISLESFTPSGLAGPMRSARRIARALQLGDPLLAPGLVDDTAREPPA
jgi:hypothetical protein